MVSAGDKGPDFPSDPSVDLDGELHGPIGLVLAERDRIVRRDRHLGAVDEGGPDVDILVALVGRRDGGAEGDLLVAIGGVHVEPVVVDADLVVGVSGGDGDLEVGGQEVRGGEIEGVDGGVLEDEPGLVGLEDGPHEKHHHQNDEGQDKYASTESPAHPAPSFRMATAVLRRHVGG